MLINNRTSTELINYIKKNLKKGYTKESLRWALINQDYSKLEVEKAIKRVDQELAMKAPILKTKPIIRHEIINSEENIVTIKPIAKKLSFWTRFFN
jgi:hypothetical protein